MTREAYRPPRSHKVCRIALLGLVVTACITAAILPLGRWWCYYRADARCLSFQMRSLERNSGRRIM